MLGFGDVRFRACSRAGLKRVRERFQREHEKANENENEETALLPACFLRGGRPRCRPSPMKRFPLFALAAALVVLSGCATQKTKTGRNVSFLGGLVDVKSGSYQSAPATTLEVDGNMVGRSNPGGTKTSILWGLFTVTNN